MESNMAASIIRVLTMEVFGILMGENIHEPFIWISFENGA
jgi:hypothetical protein